MADNFIMKALRGILPTRAESKEGRGTMSGFVRGVSPLYGQPYPEQVDTTNGAAGMISRERMREIVLRTPTAAACMNAILDFAGGVKIGVRNLDPSIKVNAVQAKKVKKILARPNVQQTRRQFLQALMRDLITFGYGAIELVNTGDTTNPVDMWVMDSARLKIDFDEHGYIRGFDMLSARGTPIIEPGAVHNQNGNSVQYDFPSGPGIGYMGQESILNQASGDTAYTKATDIHGWEPSEVILFTLNPISESVYPHSRIVQLFTAAVLEDLMMQFISERFTDSNIPFGIMDLGDISETELRVAIDNWNTQGKSGNRILMTGSRGSGSKWIPFGYHLKDLEATALLSEFRMKIMGILGVTMQELGESQDVNKSNGYNLSFTFKKRAIEPMLDEITETLTRRLLWETLGYEDIELYYEEIDSRDDYLMSQIDTNYQKLGLLTPNEIRNRRGLTSVKGGDESIIFTGNSWIPMSMVHKMAEQIILVEEQTTSIGATGAEGLRVRDNIPSGANQQFGGGPGGQSPTPAPTSIGGPSNNNRGAPSTTARQIAGKGISPDILRKLLDL